MSDEVMDVEILDLTYGKGRYRVLVQLRGYMQTDSGPIERPAQQTEWLILSEEPRVFFEVEKELRLLSSTMGAKGDWRWRDDYEEIALKVVAFAAQSPAPTPQQLRKFWRREQKKFIRQETGLESRKDNETLWNSTRSKFASGVRRNLRRLKGIKGVSLDGLGV